MKLYKNKVWTVLDIGLLKWSCILFGMLLGSYMSAFVRRHLWILTIIALLLAVKPSIDYFSDDE